MQPIMIEYLSWMVGLIIHHGGQNFKLISFIEGTMAEFDTVLNLFDQGHSIFRCLCDEAGLSRQDILRIRNESIEIGPATISGSS